MDLVSCPKHIFTGLVELPLSKSVSNRLLILGALSGGKVRAAKLSDADDTRLLKKCLEAAPQTDILNAGNAGTAYRFLTAYLACQSGTWRLGCSDRMKERPIAPLVNALRFLGADIQYEENEGFPPLRICGKKLPGGFVTVEATMSSQYVSALLMIAPTLEQGLELEMTGDPYSRPYVDMTLGLIKKCGARVRQRGNRISVSPGNYRKTVIMPERDWSSAAFLYELASLSKDSVLILEGLIPDGLQGDAVAEELFKQLGVRTQYLTHGALLQTGGRVSKEISYDFRNCPDLFIPFAFACAGKGVELVATGLRNLRSKESDRLQAVHTELSKMGFACEEVNDDTFVLYPGHQPVIPEGHHGEAYYDHRMAMALAVFAAKTGKIRLHSLADATKSFPGFRSEMRNLGFRFSVERPRH